MVCFLSTDLLKGDRCITLLLFLVVKMGQKKGANVFSWQLAVGREQGAKEEARKLGSEEEKKRGNGEEEKRRS